MDAKRPSTGTASFESSKSGDHEPGDERAVGAFTEPRRGTITVPAVVISADTEPGDMDEIAAADKVTIEKRQAPPQLELDLVELMRLANRKFEIVDAALVAKFNRIADEKGNRLFSVLDRDTQVRQFVRSLTLRELSIERKKNVAKTDEEADWEDEEHEHQTLVDDRVIADWDKLRQDKKEMMFDVMSEAAQLLLQRFVPPGDQSPRQPGATPEEKPEAKEKPKPQDSEAQGDAEATSTVLSPKSPKKAVGFSPPAAPAGGLFTANFKWDELPPALKAVYDKQGHRQEVIDGNTFWQFLSLCTPTPKAKDRSRFEDDPSRRRPEEEGEGESGEGGLTPEQLMMFLALLTKSKKPAGEGETEKPQGERRGSGGSDKAAEEGLDKPEDDEELGALLEKLQGDDMGMQLLSALMGGDMGQSAPPMTPEDQRAKKMEQFLSDRRRDPDRQHIADMWDLILHPEEEHDQQKGERKKSFGLSDRFREWKRKETEDESSESLSKA